MASHDGNLDVSFVNPLFARICLEIKAFCDNYIDRNGVMKTVAGVPIPVVGGLWK